MQKGRTVQRSSLAHWPHLSEPEQLDDTKIRGDDGAGGRWQTAADSHTPGDQHAGDRSVVRSDLADARNVALGSDGDGET